MTTNKNASKCKNKIKQNKKNKENQITTNNTNKNTSKCKNKIKKNKKKKKNK